MKSKKDILKRETQLYSLERQYGKKLYHLCTVYQPYNRRLRDELYSDVLYRLWRSLDRMDPDSDPWPWVFGIASRAAKSMRHHRIFIWRRLTEADAELPDSAADNSVIDTLYRLIDSLGQNERELVYLYLDGVPQQCIADTLGIPRSTVASRIAAIKKRLKILYENENH